MGWCVGFRVRLLWVDCTSASAFLRSDQTGMCSQGNYGSTFHPAPGCPSVSSHRPQRDSPCNGSSEPTAGCILDRVYEALYVIHVSDIKPSR